jgi:hypothetical protein
MDPTDPTHAPSTPPPPGASGAAATVAESIRPTPLAAILAWVLPGLGYVARGELARGLAVGGSILALILGGLLVGGPDTIDSHEQRWWFLVQMASGPVVLSLDQVHQKVLKVPANDGRPGRVPPHPIAEMNAGGQPPSYTRSVARVNESGRLAIVVAGMLNMIAILDCMAVRRRRDDDAPGAAPGGVAGGAS